MKKPTASQINPFNCLDGSNAEKNFLGKSVGEATEMLESSFELYQEDLMWMGPEAFCYYWESIERYVRSDKSINDWNVINYLPGIIQFQLENNVTVIIHKIQILAEYVAGNLQRFEEVQEEDMVEDEIELHNTLVEKWKETINNIRDYNQTFQRTR